MILRQQNRTVCPVQLLLDYLQLRGPCDSPLFLNEAKQPVSRETFADLLALVFRHSGLKFGRYTSHSFRIAAASWAAEQVLSNAQIWLMGRWKSNAFKQYIRINSFKTTSVGT